MIDLSDPDINFLSIEKNRNKLGMHAWVFMLGGITTKLKYSFSYFARNNLTERQLFIIILGSSWIT